MCKIVWHTWFLAYEDNCPVAYIGSWILLKRKEIIGKLVLVLDIELHYTYRRVFQCLHNKSKAPGLVYCIVVVVSLLLSFIIAYDVTFLRSSIGERHRICTGQQQTALLHNLHTNKTCTAIIVCKYIRMQNIYPLHQLFGLLCRRRSFRISLSEQYIYSVSVSPQPCYTRSCERLRYSTSSVPVNTYGYASVHMSDTEYILY